MTDSKLSFQLPKSLQVGKKILNESQIRDKISENQDYFWEIEGEAIIFEDIYMYIHRRMFIKEFYAGSKIESEE